MTILPYAGLSALLGCLPAAGLFFLVSNSPMDLLAVWAGGFLIFFFIFEGKNRAQSQEKLTKTLEKVSQAQSQVDAKLSRLEEAQREESPSENIVGELKILQDLVQRMAEQEIGSHEEAPLERASETVSVQVIHEKASSTGEDGEIEEEVEVQELSRERLLSIIKGALREDRIEMLLQPIVSLPQRKTRAFECYSRLRDEKGTIIIPDHYLGIAEEQDLIRIIDNTLLLRCVQLIRKAIKKRVSAPFFCNLSLATLRNKTFLEGFIEFIAQNKNITPVLVFEVDFDEIRQASDASLDALTKLVSEGCRFSVDHISNIEALDLKQLKAFNVKYLKLDISILLKALEKDPSGKSIETFKKQADKMMIDLIITKVEEEKELVEMLDFQFDFGQGFLFGKPRLIERW